jgi:hypothetical protein
MMKDESRQNRSGQLLIEAMVAVSLLLVGLLGVFAVLSQSLGLNRVATDQHIAVQLASEGVEIVKNIIDKDARMGTGSFAQSLSGAIGDVTLDYTTDLTEGYEIQAYSAANPAYLRLDPTTKRYGYRQGDITKFKRYVKLSFCSDPGEVACVGESKIVRAKSVVEWDARGGLLGHVEVEDVFYDWRYPAP